MSGHSTLARFQPAVREWFSHAFDGPTTAQVKGWQAIAGGESTLLLAPTGSGKTLAAFLWCLNRLMFEPPPEPRARCRVLYVSPLKALAVDVERNLRAPIAGIANQADLRGEPYHTPAILVRTGDTPAAERARFQRDPADIVITTPESLYLMLTSQAREAFAHLDTVIIDEIHALAPTKRGAHLALSLERLEALTASSGDGPSGDGRPLQRIGLSATVRPLDEIARYLVGARRSPAPAPKAKPVKPAAKRRGKAATAEGTAAEDAAALATREIHDEFADAAGVEYRPATIANASARKALRLKIEVPVEDMARLGEPQATPSGPAAQGPVRDSIWTAMHPRLLALVRDHRSTLIFVNSRRIAERLAAAINELAGEPLVRAHHGSVARTQRVEIEDDLKAGRLRGLVATSTLELGIDMGAIDLVVQIEAPPSVASGLQRIGRASHQVGATSEGIIFPKYRGDLVACAAAARSMHEGQVEAMRYPRNPLDVLAQQIVAMTAMDRWDVDTLYAVIRQAAPFAELDRAIFDGVLDMLAGRYPSDEFAELRPRVTWDRTHNTIVAREGAKRVAIANGGTIPDRGLYSVFLAGAPHATRVGELDEEMVFESRAGETFMLGASTWRIEEITHDRVLVSPAPGEPGKMPFWKGETAGRPLEFGRAIGALMRTLKEQPKAASLDRLERDHDLDRGAAENLLKYLDDQKAAGGQIPDDRTIVIERCRDELGDWRMCLLSPLGGQVLAPWAMAVIAKIREQLDIEVESMWTDDGLVIRFPETDEAPDPQLLVPDAEDVERLVLRQLGSSALFAAKFREAAARALLLPRRRIGGRTPLWHQRKRAADLLAVAARFGSFPMLLETYRECLRDLFDVPALVATLRAIAMRQIRVVSVDSTSPSPFAASLLFGYVANYIYDGDAPLAERRAQALLIDQTQLRALLGEAELRELLNADAIDATERQLQYLDPSRHVKSADGIHDLLLRVGDLCEDEIARRTRPGLAASAVPALVEARRLLVVPVAGERRLIAAEDASRYRDALGVPLPVGLPDAFVAPVRQPMADLVQRYARTHGPFTTREVAGRWGVGVSGVDATLKRLTANGRVLEGAFRPGGTEREWCEPGVLSQIRRLSLAKLRHEIAPVPAPMLGRLVTTWQGVSKKRKGVDALLDAIETLQGAPLPASLLESDILPARIDGYTPADLDMVLGAGEVVWCGVEPLGERDGRIALYLTDRFATLWRPRVSTPSASAKAARADLGVALDEPLGEREREIETFLRAHGASFFAAVHDAMGAGFPGETIDALWSLVWRGLVTNDSFQALRAYVTAGARTKKNRRPYSNPDPGPAFRSRRQVPPTGGGRWSLIETRQIETSLTGPRPATPPTATLWSTAMAQQLLARYGLITREVAAAESLPGGFSAIYDVLKALEDAGRIRRGYFVSDVGATQFVMPAALDLLRSFRERDEDAPETVLLSATDPANPYGTLLKWPDQTSSIQTSSATPDRAAGDGAAPAGGRGPTRTVGSQVILIDGRLAAYLSRTRRQLLSWLPEDEPDRGRTAAATARVLATLAREGEGREGGLLIAEIDGRAASTHPLAPALVEAGFVSSAMGFQMLRPTVSRQLSVVSRQ